MSNEGIDVLFAFMPFGNPILPSLGVSLLKAGLKKHSVNSRISYYNLDFAKRLSMERYLLLATSRQWLSCEWVFSQLAFGKNDLQDRRAHDEALPKLIQKPFKSHGSKRVMESPITPEHFRSILIQARDQADGFVDSCVDDIERVNPKILGFSTMFSQNCSSLAVARRVKERLGAKSPMVVFGGSNCEGTMGYTMLKAFPWIDYVCCGEGDRAFIDFADNVLKGRSRAVQGILGRNEDSFDEFSTPAPIRNMDELPFPDFEDYFLTLQTSGLNASMIPQLAVETSRGCWWGEKSQCMFCGLNGLSMEYRSKSGDRILRELNHLNKQWGPLTFQVVDNILNMDLFKSLFPQLIQRRMKLNLLFETKSNLNREQLRLLKKAGVRHIQPGIESLSDDTLDLMKKGVTGLQNVWLLKACREIGIAASWTWLAGFPGEKVSEYERMRPWVPLLHHLQPPLWFGTIRLDRFSPLFNQQEKFGICGARANSLYELIYPLDEKTLYDLAYHFDFDYKDNRVPEEYTEQFGEEILEWMHKWNISAGNPVVPILRRPIVDRLVRPFLAQLGAPVPAMLGAPVLSMLDLRVGLLIWDTRSCSTRSLFVLRGLEASVIRYTNNVQRYDAVIQHFVDLGYESADIKRALSTLLEKKLLILDSEKCLSLVPKATVSMILARLFSGYLRMLPRLMNVIHRRQAIQVEP